MTCLSRCDQQKAQRTTLGRHRFIRLQRGGMSEIIITAHPDMLPIRGQALALALFPPVI